MAHACDSRKNPSDSRCCQQVWLRVVVLEEEDKPARDGARSCEMQDATSVCLETAGERARKTGGAVALLKLDGCPAIKLKALL